MLHWREAFLYGVILCFALGSVRHAHAGQITGVGAETPAGVGVPMYDGRGPINNDNASVLSAHWSGDYRLTFDRPNQPVDVVFIVQNSGGVSEVDWLGTLHNSTGAKWAGFEMTLGFGTGEAFTEAALPGLDFDLPHKDNTFKYNYSSAAAHTAAHLGWPDAGDASDLAFSADIPDADSLDPALSVIPDSELLPDGYRFTIRHTPITLPEPAGLAIFGALGGLLLSRRGISHRNPEAERRKS